MMKKLQSYSQLITMLLKTISIVIRFAFFYWLATVFSISEYGTYSLINTIVTIAVVILGVDQYVFYNRELSLNKDRSDSVISNQFATSVPLAILTVLVGAFVFRITNYFPNAIIIFLSLVCITEWWLQEITRILIIQEKPLAANVLMFTRSCIYPALIFIYYLSNLYISNQGILILWLISNIIHCGIFVVMFHRFLSFERKSLRWENIKKPIAVSFPFFISTLGLKVIEYSNKFIIDAIMSRESVGVYSFFNSIYSNINSIVFSSIVIFQYPRLMNSVSDNNLFASNKKSFFKSMSLFMGLLLFGIVILFVIIPYMGIGDLYKSNIHLLGLFYIASVFYNLSLINHYSLYSKKHDGLIIKITIFVAVCSLVLNFLFVKLFGLVGACSAVIISNAMLFVLKYVNDRTF